MRYLLLLFLLLGHVSLKAQETYRKAFRLADGFSSAQTKKIEEDRLISRALLTTPIVGVPANNSNIETASSIIKVLSGTVTATATEITILKGAQIEETTKTPLLKVTPVKFKDLLPAQQRKLAAKYPDGRVVTYTIERKLPEGKVSTEEKVTVNQAFLEKLTLDSVTIVTTKPATWGYVKFDEDKVWVSPDLVGYTDPGLHYYQLQNRHTIRLWTTDISISALTMPVKYRFKGTRDSNGKAFCEDFASAVNVNVFVGPSFGKTSFHYREKVGNISNTWKITVGLIGGGSTVKLNKSNTISADKPITGDTEITKGLLSLGFGATYSYNKATVGAFLGKDYSIGQDANLWDYNRHAWLGIAIGYSIFSI